MFFFLFHQSFSLSKYNRELYSSVITERIDEKNKTFQCRFDSKLIPLDKLNDDNCDCCDCSDEFINITLNLKNHCLDINEIENRAQLLSFYKESISIRNQLLNSNIKKITKLQNKISNIENEIAQQEQLFNQTNKKLKMAKYNLVKWAYEKNNLKMPTEEELEKQKQDYINKESNYEIQNGFSSYKRKYNEDEEESEGFSPRKEDNSHINEYEIQERRRRRAAKFEKEQKEKIKELIRKAAEKTRQYGSFLSKLMPDTQMPQEIIDVEILREKKTNVKNNLNTLEMKKSKLDIQMQYTKMGPLWYKGFKKAFRKSIEGEKGDLNIVLFHFANAVLETGQKEIGTYYTLNNTRMQFMNKKNVEIDGLNTVLNVHLICSSSDKIYTAMKLCPSRYEAFIGIPEICEETFSNEGFNQFISDSKPFLNQIFSSTAEL